MAERRTLSFTNVDQIMPDVDRLLEGHRTVGNWSLGQICNHLNIVFRGSIDGFSFKAPWLLRKTLCPVIKRRILKTGVMPAGARAPEKILPKPGLDDRAEVEALRASLRQFTAHGGAVADHPFFERLTRSEWERLHCIHCAHHLSFAWPE